MSEKSAEPGTQLMNDILASNQGYERGGELQRYISGMIIAFKPPI